jgi:hypothetical protein
LLLAKMRPYESKGAKAKDGYDAYMLLAFAAREPEELAQAAVELPRELATELLKLVEVFFIKKQRAARDAAILLRDYRGARKKTAARTAVDLATRFVRELSSLLET